MRFTQLFLAAGLSVASTLALAHDYRAGAMRVDHPFARATPPLARIGGAYMTLTNEGLEPDRLIGGASPASARVEIHEMSVENDVMRMRPLPEGVEIPAGEAVTLAPGGLHLMLVDLAAPLAEGARVPLTLTFEKAGDVEVELAVEGFAAGAPAADADAHAGHGAH